jgi:hypothetical protein
MKRWKITIELELESPDVLLGGIPVTEGFIRERTANMLARAIKEPEHSYWRYASANIAEVEDTTPRKPLFP